LRKPTLGYLTFGCLTREDLAAGYLAREDLAVSCLVRENLAVSYLAQGNLTAGYPTWESLTVGNLAVGGLGQPHPGNLDSGNPSQSRPWVASPLASLLWVTLP